MIAVYSIYVIGEDPNLNQVYEEMLYSIFSLRSRSSMPIKVFVTPRGILNKVRKDIRKIGGVEVIEFDNIVSTLYPSYVDRGFAALLDHRWLNVLKAFELFDCDRILHLDCDTVFYNSPELLDSKYPDPTKFYARRDLSHNISNAIGINDGMNDGQFIISREIADKLKEDFYFHQKRLINDLLIRAETLLSATDHNTLHWLAVQYTMTQRLHELGIPFAEFDKADVTLSIEPSYSHKKDGCKPTQILHHYFTGNLPRYLPRIHWTSNRLKMNEKLLIGKKLCSCGYLENLESQ